jgi:hypothetical protein
LVDFPPLDPTTKDHYTWFTELDQSQRLLARILRPGDKIALCYDQGTGGAVRLTCIAPCVPVLAAHAASDEKDAYWLAVQVNDSFQQTLGRYLRAQRKLILRANH